MSKSNRIKGKYEELIGCRLITAERDKSLDQRELGLTERHVPTPRKGLPKLTKSFRKAMGKLKNKNNDPTHPLARDADAQERGAAKILGLISAAIYKPEQVACQAN